jgi:hypothetical protein
MLIFLIQTINQKANQQRYHQINVPNAPHIIIFHIEKSLFDNAKAVAANGRTIANAIVKSSKQFLIFIITDVATGYLTSIISLPQLLGLTLFQQTCKSK